MVSNSKHGIVKIIEGLIISTDYSINWYRLDFAPMFGIAEIQ